MAPRATMAMAKELARIWANGRGFPVHVQSGRSATGDPTRDALLRRVWVYPGGEAGTFPNGSAFQMYLINEDGMLALELFLLERRVKVAKPPRERILK